MDRLSELYCQCIDAFYQCASGIDRWHHAAGLVRAFVGTDFVNLNFVQIHRHIQSVHASGLTEAQKAHYLQHWVHRDPLPIYAIQQPELIPYTHEDVLPAELDWRATEVAQAFYEPAGMYFHAGGHLDLGNGWFAILATHRDWASGALGPEGLRRIEHLLRHLRRAMMLAIRLQTLSIEANSMKNILTGCDGAVVLCDQSGYPIELSAEASRYLNSTLCPLRLRDCRLEACDPDANTRLQRLIDNPEYSDHYSAPVLVTRDRCGTPVECTVINAGASIPGRALRLLVIRRANEASSVDPHFLRYRLDLTPVEAQVLRRLMLGDSVKDVADYRGTTVETTRSCVKALLKKLQCHSQAQLVAKGWRATATFTKKANGNAP